jgi:hypothetical protein
MKSIVMPKNVQLDESIKNQISSEVKETLDTKKTQAGKINFTVAEMWNRQRKGRSASDMMRRWNLN